MKEIKTDDVVTVHYTGSLEDGTVFDTSPNREPFEFKVGEGKVIPGFNDAVIGKKKGEMVKITIPHAEAYGPYQKERLQKISKKNLQPDLKPEVDMELISKYPDGQETIVRICSVEEDHIVIDANHPLAGRDLTFEITIVDVKE